MNDSEDDLLRTEITPSMTPSTSEKFSGIQAKPINPNLENEILIFPKQVEFPPSFVNIQSSKKIIITNSSKDDATFLVNLKGKDPSFLVSVSSISIPSGKSSSLSVSYKPTKLGNNYSILELTGPMEVTLSITGSCIDIPLIVQPQDSDVWHLIDPTKKETEIDIINRDKVRTYKCICTSNTSSIKLSQNVVNIFPNATETIKATLIDSNNIYRKPQFSLVCEETGTTIIREFIIDQEKQTFVIDFGKQFANSKVSRSIKKEAFNKDSQIVQKPKEPFDVVFNNGSFSFVFSPTRENTYLDVAKFNDKDVQLRGECIPLPFAFDETTFRITNLTKQMLNLEISSLTKGVTVMNTPLTIDPLLSQVLTLKVDRNDSVIPDFEVRYETARIILHSNKEVSKQSTKKVTISEVTELAPSSLSSTPMISNKEINQSTQSNETNQEKSEEIQNETNSNQQKPEKQNIAPKQMLNNNNKKNIKNIKEMPNIQNDQDNDIFVDPQTIVLPNVSKEIPAQQTFLIECESTFDVEAPKWLQFPTSISSQVPFTIQCKSIGRRETCSHVSIISKTEEVSVPVIAYTGKSIVSCPPNARLRYEMGQTYVGEVEVFNEGDRTAFALLTAAEEMDIDVKLSPPACVIPPNYSQVFEFVVESPPKLGLEIPLVLYSGDEILRQIKAVISPSDFFVTAFDGIETQTEIVRFQKVLNEIDPKAFSRIFKKNVFVHKLKLITPDKNSAKRIAISPESILILGDEGARVTLTNMSPDNISFTAFALNPAVTVFPTQGIIPKYEEVQIFVDMLKKTTTSIELRTEDGVISIPVSYSKAFIADFPVGRIRETFSLKSKVIDFGLCEETNTRKINVSLSNLTGNKISLTVRSKSKNYRTEKVFTYPFSVTIKPLSVSEFIVEFTPNMKYTFEEVLILDNDGDTQELKLIGKGIPKPKKEMGAETESVDFPLCEVGKTKKGTIKVANRSTKATRFTAIVTYPFFCPVTSFLVEARNYVLFPIHFSPKTEGTFKSEVRFTSKDGKPFSVVLRGSSFLPN